MNLVLTGFKLHQSNNSLLFLGENVLLNYLVFVSVVNFFRFSPEICVVTADGLFFTPRKLTELTVHPGSKSPASSAELGM